MTSFTPTRVTLKGDNDLGGTHRSEAGLGWSGLALSGTASAGDNDNNFQHKIERRGEPGGLLHRDRKVGGLSGPGGNRRTSDDPYGGRRRPKGSGESVRRRLRFSKHATGPDVFMGDSAGGWNLWTCRLTALGTGLHQKMGPCDFGGSRTRPISRSQRKGPEKRRRAGDRLVNPASSPRACPARTSIRCR